MPTIKQFEKALKAKSVEIESLSQTSAGVRKVIGPITITCNWDAKGRCFYRSHRLPPLDITNELKNIPL